MDSTADDAHRRRGRRQPPPPPVLTALETAIRDSDGALAARLENPVYRVGAIARRVQRSRPARVVRHYLTGDGNLLAAGMTFQSLFAIFAAVFVAFSVFGVWLTRNDQVFGALLDLVNGWVPGLMGDGGVIDAQELVRIEIVSGTGLIALGGLLWTTLVWFYYTRQAIRSIFRLPRDQRPFFRQKAADLLLALVFSVALLAAAGATVAGSRAWELIGGFLGWGEQSTAVSVLIRGSGILLGAALNIAVIACQFRFLAHIPLKPRALLTGSTIGGLALTGLSALAGAIIGGVGNNPLLATFAVFVGLLVWLNLVSRLVLLSASWVAVGTADRGLAGSLLSEDERELQLARAGALLAETALAEARSERALGGPPWRRLMARRRLRAATRRADEARHRLDDIAARTRVWLEP